MAHPLKHAQRCTRKFDGLAQEYLSVHTGLMNPAPTSRIFGIAVFGTTARGSSCVKASSALPSPTAKANKCRYVTSTHGWLVIYAGTSVRGYSCTRNLGCVSCRIARIAQCRNPHGFRRGTV